MSGKHITQQQEDIYMKHRQSTTQELSAAKAGISIRTGRRIEKGEKPDSVKRYWKTRKDPFEAVWSSVLEPLLEQDSDPIRVEKQKDHPKDHAALIQMAPYWK